MVSDARHYTGYDRLLQEFPEENLVVDTSGENYPCVEDVHGASSAIDERTRRLVDSKGHLKFTEDEARVVCTLTGHEVVPDYMEILKYLGSKRMQRILADGPFDMEVISFLCPPSPPF